MSTERFDVCNHKLPRLQLARQKFATFPDFLVRGLVFAVIDHDGASPPAAGQRSIGVLLVFFGDSDLEFKAL